MYVCVCQSACVHDSVCLSVCECVCVCVSVCVFIYCYNTPCSMTAMPLIMTAASSKWSDIINVGSCPHTHTHTGQATGTQLLS